MKDWGGGDPPAIAFVLMFLLPLQQIKRVATPRLPLAFTLTCMGARSKDNDNNDSWGGKGGGDVDYCAIVPPPIARMIAIVPTPISHVRMPTPMMMTTMTNGADHHVYCPPAPKKTCNGGRWMMIIVIIVDATSNTAGKIIATVVVVITLLMIMTTMTIAIIVVDAKATTVDGGPQGRLHMFAMKTQGGWKRITTIILIDKVTINNATDYQQEHTVIVGGRMGMGGR
jgi:hypothetical protein